MVLDRKSPGLGGAARRDERHAARGPGRCLGGGQGYVTAKEEPELAAEGVREGNSGGL